MRNFVFLMPLLIVTLCNCTSIPYACELGIYECDLLEPECNADADCGPDATCDVSSCFQNPECTDDYCTDDCWGICVANTHCNTDEDCADGDLCLVPDDSDCSDETGPCGVCRPACALACDDGTACNIVNGEARCSPVACEQHSDCPDSMRCNTDDFCLENPNCTPESCTDECWGQCVIGDGVNG